MTRELFFQTLDDIMWEDTTPTISSYLLHTSPIKDVYIRRGLMSEHPSPVKLSKWLTSAGYTRLGAIGARPGYFWTMYPDLFTTFGMADHKAVTRCIKRRQLYLKVKSKLREREIYSVGEVAEIFGVSINSIRTWDLQKLLPAIRTVGGHRRYDLSDLVNFAL